MFNKKTDGKKNNRSALWTSLPIFLTIFIVLYFIVNIANVQNFIDKLNAILSPIFIGLVIAYLMNPIFRLFENKVFKWKKDNVGKRRLCRVLSLFCTFIVFLAIIALLILLIVPQLVDSIVQIITDHERYISTVIDFVNELAKPMLAKFSHDPEAQLISYDTVHNYIHSLFATDDAEGGDKLSSFINKYSQEITTIGTEFALGLITFLKDFVIGIFIAFFILGSKELRGAQIKKIRRAIFTREQNRFVSEFLYISKKSFGGFLRGKSLASVAIGIITYICLVIFDISDYKVLIATIVGVTNIIPVFGPFIGAIPSAVIVLMCDPHKVLLFLILILVLQLLEGNVISPKIIGDSTNISSLAVIIAISTMGGLFGIVGMLIGVPVFAIIINLTDRSLEKRLAAKGFPTKTEDYLNENSMSDLDIILHKQEGTWYNKIKQSMQEHKEKKAKRKNKSKDVTTTTDCPVEKSEEHTVEPATNESTDVKTEE